MLANSTTIEQPIELNKKLIESIIAEERIKILFQPIVSTYQGKVAGVEALARGIDNEGQFIPPLRLFEAAAEAGLVIPLDRLCQRKAMEAFSMRPPKYQDLILFLNVDNSVIHLDNNILAINDYALDVHLSPEQVVLEINELASADITAVQNFVQRYRNLGFMISIDDIGAGYSNLDRLILLEPDIIKIDRQLIKDVHSEYYKQQVVEMIIRLSEKTGSLVVAEGVEELDEIMMVLQYGAQLLQGFYISRPMDMTVTRLEDLDDVIAQISEAQKNHLANHLIGKCDFNVRLRDKFHRFNNQFKNYDEKLLANTLEDLLIGFPEIECAYVINEEGHQMTNTVFNKSFPTLHAKSLFTPFNQGDDATLKAYYYVLKTTNQPLYISEEYLSLATGHHCITISGWTQIGKQKSILCLDIILPNN